jgi:hypothetical protein
VVLWNGWQSKFIANKITKQKKILSFKNYATQFKSTFEASNDFKNPLKLLYSVMQRKYSLPFVQNRLWICNQTIFGKVTAISKVVGNLKLDFRVSKIT